MSSEQSLLRTSLLGSLLDVASRNRAQGATALRLFEAGAVFIPKGPGELPDEPYDLAALLCGPVRRPTWRDPDPQEADFFAIKGVLEGVLGALGAAFELRPAKASFVHPGRAASAWVGGNPVGWLGELHPLVTAEWDIEDPVAAFEINLDAVPLPVTSAFQGLASFPAVREDLAVVVSEQVTAAQVVETVQRAGAPLLSSVEVFDRYLNPELLGEGNVSLALRLSYRAPDRTLTDEEVASKRAEITESLASELEGRVRAS